MGKIVSDPVDHTGRSGIFEWPITVLSGIILCAVTLSGVQAHRSHGILVLVVTLIAVTGIAQSSASQGLRGPAKVLGMVIVSLATSSILWLTGFLPSLFIASAFCLTQVCAITARITLGNAFNGTALVLGLSTLILSVLSMFAAWNLEMVVLLMCLTSLMIALCDLSFKPQRVFENARLQIDCLSLTNTADLWIAAMLLSPAQAILYFAARLTTLLLPAVLHSFETLIAPAIVQTHRQSKHSDFVSAMARVNLSFFLIAAAVATMLATFQPSVSTTYLNVGSFGTTATYLLVAIFVPAALGQSAIVAQILLPRSAQDLASIFGSIGAAGMLVFRPEIHANDIAQSYAVYRILAASILSFHVIKHHRIWPGPTALFVKKIRVFT